MCKICTYPKINSLYILCKKFRGHHYMNIQLIYFKIYWYISKYIDIFQNISILSVKWLLINDFFFNLKKKVQKKHQVLLIGGYVAPFRNTQCQNYLSYPIT